MVSPAAQMFASTGGGMVSHTFTVTNQGAVTTGPIVFNFGGGGGIAFMIASTNCSTLPPNQTCTVQVMFNGNAAANSTLLTHATPGGNANDVVLTGTTM